MKPEDRVRVFTLAAGRSGSREVSGPYISQQFLNVDPIHSGRLLLLASHAPQRGHFDAEATEGIDPGRNQRQLYIQVIAVQ